jgi:hypothetical protein
MYAPAPVRGIGQAQAPGTLSTVSTQIGSGLLATAGLVSQTAGPIAGAAVAAAGGIAELVGAVSKLFQGCGATCTEATTLVNQVEPYLIQNNQIYFTNPNRTTADQATAAATFQQIWATITSTQGCGNPALGSAGQNCINERGPNATGCTFGYTTANEYPPYCSVPYPVGVCWNWFLAYYDPIINDVPPGGVSTVATGTSSTSGTIAGIPSGLLLGIVGVVILLMVVEG